MLDVLIVEDDAVDAYLVQELLTDADTGLRLSRATDLSSAEEMISATTRCIVLDLNLPDSTGLDGLHRLLRHAPSVAVVVLTGLHDEQLGVQAVAAGAQDYLTKGEIDGPLLARTIRYAVERQESHRYRLEAELHAQENARLERGLLPVPTIGSPAVSCHTSYQPGRPHTLLGGDFYDVVETADGTLQAVIGDVCGHGPDEAALGVCLRVAWRSLVMAGLDDLTLFPVLQQLLVAERRTDEIFTTACMITLVPDSNQVRVLSAGHPPPLLLDFGATGGVSEALPSSTGPALGLVASPTWRTAEIELTGPWGVLLYTDGIVEGHVGNGSERLGVERLTKIIDSQVGGGLAGADLLRATIAEVIELDGGRMTDDIAALLVARRSG
ncbi:MAG: fused response regulator/phosphatase [Sporichthyaceae bacterium]|nr:fused response regulator/phosphatase [Sporichthyaceae bacterium]